MGRPNFSRQQEYVVSFIKFAHGEQMSKYIEKPYYEHPIRVAGILMESAEGIISHDVAVEIALLHDVLEDTKISVMEIYRFLHYGCDYEQKECSRICEGVVDLSDVYTKTAYPDYNRATRKTLEAFRLSEKGFVVQSVKCADLIDNIRTIKEYDTTDFVGIFLNEAENLLLRLNDADTRLRKLAFSTLYSFMENKE